MFHKIIRKKGASKIERERKKRELVAASYFNINDTWIDFCVFSKKKSRAIKIVVLNIQHIRL